MTPTEFLKTTERTDNYNIPSNLHTLILYGYSDGEKTGNIAHILHAALGLGGEVGELQDALIKHFVYGKSLDRVNLKEELGDCLWFIGKMLRQLDSTFEEIMEINNR